MADEYPWVRKILSNDSTVWILFNRNGNPDSILYKINFGNFNKIFWQEEQDYTLFDSINNENEKILKRTYSIIDSLNNANNTNHRKPNMLNNNWWSIEEEWSEIERHSNTFLCYRKSDVWKRKIYQLPTNLVSVLHMERGHRRRIWIGGLCFVGYYYNEVFTRLFFIDDYKLQGTEAYICTEEINCPEEKEPEQGAEEDMTMYGDSYPLSICYCDGRKLGYIQSENGYANFYKEFDDNCTPILGIILDKARIFYWDIEDNTNWYRVEINDVMGYVCKDNIVATTKK